MSVNVILRDSIRKEDYDYVVEIKIPKARNGEDFLVSLKKACKDEYRLAAKNGSKKVAATIVYEKDMPADFLETYIAQKKAAYEIVNEDEIDLDITLAISIYIKNCLSQVVRLFIEKRVTHSPSTSGNIFGMIYQKVEVPDELHNLIKGADFQNYFNDDVTPMEIFNELLEKKQLKRSDIQKETIMYLGKSTFYNAFDKEYKKSFDKETIITIALAMGLNVEETTRVLNAAGMKFDEKDPKDLIYVYSLAHKESLENMNAYINAELSE